MRQCFFFSLQIQPQRPITLISSTFTPKYFVKYLQLRLAAAGKRRLVRGAAPLVYICFAKYLRPTAYGLKPCLIRNYRLYLSIYYQGGWFVPPLFPPHPFWRKPESTSQLSLSVTSEPRCSITYNPLQLVSPKFTYS
jgi:hypothetical protein